MKTLSTELMPEGFPVALTSKYGGKDRGNVLQVTIGSSYMDINKSEARCLANTLDVWSSGAPSVPQNGFEPELTCTNMDCEESSPVSKWKLKSCDGQHVCMHCPKCGMGREIETPYKVVAKFSVEHRERY